MKLVLTFDLTDGISYNDTFHEPFEYESKGKAEFDLLQLYQDWYNTGKTNYTSGDTKLGNLPIDLSYFDYSSKDTEPKIRTLEEWFDYYNHK